MVSGMVSPDCQEKEDNELALLGQCVGKSHLGRQGGRLSSGRRSLSRCDAESALTPVLRNWSPWELLHPAEPGGLYGKSQTAVGTRALQKPS